VRTVFVDTSYLLALVRQKDALHSRAVAWQRIITGLLVTTELVLIEFVDALSAPPVRSVAASTIDEIRDDSNVRIIPASSVLFDDGFSMFKQFVDKGWSLTDCISFHVMRQERLHNALTNDHDFEQAGFRALLRMDPSKGEVDWN
jgi:hypothetical protein